MPPTFAAAIISTSGDINASGENSYIGPVQFTSGSINTFGGDITAGNIIAGNVTAENINATNIIAGNVTAGNVTAGNINATNIVAGNDSQIGGVTFKNGNILNVLSYGTNVYDNGGSVGSIHAEMKAICNLQPHSPNKKHLIKLDILVIRTSNIGKIGMSKPFFKCILDL